MTRTSSRQGFTLIELLLVIGIIAILAAIVIVAINPTKQLGDARDAERRNGVNTILNAIWQYAIDHGGNLPCQGTSSDDTTTTPCVDGSWRVLGTDTTGCDSTVTCPVSTVARVAACLDLSRLASTYVVSIPGDPKTGTTAGNRRYIVSTPAGGRVTVSACNPEQTGSISVTR